MRKDDAFARLQRQLDFIPALWKMPESSPEFEKWYRDTQVAIEKIFGPESRNVRDFDRVDFYLSVATNNTPQSAYDEAYRDGLESAGAVLRSFIDEIRDYWPDDANLPGSPVLPAKVTGGKDTFLVHGWNETALHSVARYLERLGLNVIVLREQPSKGRTVIEKFVDYSAVRFAIVLLTGDDRGGPADGDPNDQRLRPRQNVLLELGFFLGKLGRENVCALYEEGVEIPSDYQGVVYVPLDSAGAWKRDLAREIHAAGLAIDLSKAL